jgi:hypothetical protein
MPSFDLSPEVGGFRLQKILLCIDSANILDLLQIRYRVIRGNTTELLFGRAQGEKEMFFGWFFVEFRVRTENF